MKLLNTGWFDINYVEDTNGDTPIMICGKSFNQYNKQDVANCNNYRYDALLVHFGDQLCLIRLFCFVGCMSGINFDRLFLLLLKQKGIDLSIVNKNGRNLVQILQIKEKSAFINYLKYKLKNKTDNNDCDIISWNLDVETIDKQLNSYRISDAIFSAMKQEKIKELQSIVSAPDTRRILYDILSLDNGIELMPAFLYPFKIGNSQMLKIFLKYVTSNEELKKLFDLQTNSEHAVYGFHLSVQHNKLTLVKELISMSKGKKYKDCIDIERNASETIPIDAAIANGNYEMLKLLYNPKSGNNTSSRLTRILEKCVTVKSVELKDRLGFFKKVIHTSSRFIDANAVMKLCFKSDVKEREFFEYLIKVNDLFTLAPITCYDYWCYMGNVCDSKLMKETFTTKFNGVDFVCFVQFCV